MLDNAVLKRGSVKKVLAHGAKRQPVAHLQKVFEVSRCRACVILGVGRTMVRYVSHRPDDAKAHERISELASQRRWFGYRRLRCLLCQEVGDEPQEAPAALSRGTATSAPPWRSQAGPGHTSTNDIPAGTQSALEPGLCVRCLCLWAKVRDLCCRW